VPTKGQANFRTYFQKPKRTEASLRVANCDTVKNRLAEMNQDSFRRRKLDSICRECLFGHSLPCEKDNCPCLCNDPHTG
jgi:hypothetical protein